VNSTVLLLPLNSRFFYSIFRWTTTANGSSFELVKSLKTEEPCATILLRPHSIIVGCDEFFEIDAQDFTVEGNRLNYRSPWQSVYIINPLPPSDAVRKQKKKKGSF